MVLRFLTISNVNYSADECIGNIILWLIYVEVGKQCDYQYVFNGIQRVPYIAVIRGSVGLIWQYIMCVCENYCLTDCFGKLHLSWLILADWHGFGIKVWQKKNKYSLFLKKIDRGFLWRLRGARLGGRIERERQRERERKRKIINVMIIVFVLTGTGDFQTRLKKRGMWVGFFLTQVYVHSFDVHYYYRIRRSFWGCLWRLCIKKKPHSRYTTYLTACLYVYKLLLLPGAVYFVSQIFQTLYTAEWYIIIIIILSWREKYYDVFQLFKSRSSVFRKCTYPINAKKKFIVITMWGILIAFLFTRQNTFLMLFLIYLFW